MKKIALLLLFFLLLSQVIFAQPEMVALQGGAFVMGFAHGDDDETPLHRVEISRFFMAKTEVTAAQFEVFIDSTGYQTDAELGDGSYTWDSLGWHKMDRLNWRHTETGHLRPRQDYNYPALHVSWYDAAHYCNWLSDMAGLERVYRFLPDSVMADLMADGFRLPTEAEWEYAAAWGISTQKSVYAGAGSLGVLGWYSGNAMRRVHPVAQKQANLLGIYDLSGNVWEWCHDWYDKNYYEQAKGAANPAGPVAGEVRVLRGGSWNNSGKHCRIANRTSRFPDFRDGSVGFRVARLDKSSND